MEKLVTLDGKLVVRDNNIVTYNNGELPPVIVSDSFLHLDAAVRSSYPGAGTAWNDLSGNNNDGILLNGVGYDDAYGGNMAFDGVNDYVSVPSANTKLFTEMTIEIWYRATNTERTHLWDLGVPGTNGTHLAFDFNDIGWGLGFGLWVYWNGNGGNSVQYGDMGAFTDGNIRQFTYTHSDVAARNRVYANGSMLTPRYVRGSQTFVQPVGGTNFRLGCYGDGSMFFMNGNVYSVRIYDKELSEAEVLANFNSTKARFGF
jgi:hypothetical protein